MDANTLRNMAAPQPGENPAQALMLAFEAISQAIYTEDRLDGAAGEKVLQFLFPFLSPEHQAIVLLKFEEAGNRQPS